MDQLPVQEFLRDKTNRGHDQWLALDKLQLDFKIIYSYDKNKELVILNYQQFKTPKTSVIAMDCRGIILELNTWNVVSLPFRRFFNYEESPKITKEFDLDSGLYMEKTDGSLIQCFRYKDEWRMATRGAIDGTGNVKDWGITFSDLFHKIVPGIFEKLDREYIYIFELISPKNKIITINKKEAMYLIGMRHANDFGEISPLELQNHAEKIGLKNIKVPRILKYSEVDYFIATSEMDDPGFEGVVGVSQKYDNRQYYDPLYYDEQYFGQLYYDPKHEGCEYPIKNYLRVKIKNPRYLALKRIVDKVGTKRGIVASIIAKPKDIIKVKEMFPEYIQEIDDLSEKLEVHKDNIFSDILRIKHMFNLENIVENKREYAIKLKGCVNFEFMMRLWFHNIKYDNDEQLKLDFLRIWNEHLHKLMSDRGLKYASKKVLGWIDNKR